MHIHPSSPNSDFIASSLQSEEIAAIRIQAGFRGYRVRKQLNHHQQQQPQRSSANGYHHQGLAQGVVHSHRPHQHTHRRQQRRLAGMTTPSESGPAVMSSSNGGASAAVQLHGVRNGGAGGVDAANTIEDRCATKIQAGVRGFLVRKKQKIATDAATKIQAGFRGFKARKEAQKLKQK